MASHEWDLMTDVPAGFSTCGSAQDADDEWLYLFIHPRTVRRYHMGTDTWESLGVPDTDFSGTVGDIQCMWIDGDIYIMQGDVIATRRFFIYHPATDSYTYGLDETGVVPRPYYGRIGDYIWNAGGTGRTTRQYDIAGDTWDVSGFADIPAISGHTTRHFGASAVVDGKLWALCGESSSGGPSWIAVGNTVYYDPDTDTWTSGPLIGTARRGCKAVVLSDDTIWVGPGNEGLGSNDPKSQFDRVTPPSTACAPTGPVVTCGDYVGAETISRALEWGYGMGFRRQDGMLFVVGGVEWNSPFDNDRTQRFGALDPADPVVGDTARGSVIARPFARVVP